MAGTPTVVVNADGASTNTTAQLIQFNPASQLPIKLSGSNNFTTWKAQFELLLHGHDLFSYLDGSVTSPSPTITENDKQISNPAYKIWFRQDKLIHNAILALIRPWPQWLPLPLLPKSLGTHYTLLMPTSHTLEYLT